MGIHNYNLLPTAKSRSTTVIANIDLFLYAEELYSELKSIGIINRLSAIPQLGPIKVKTKLKNHQNKNSVSSIKSLRDFSHYICILLSIYSSIECFHFHIIADLYRLFQYWQKRE